MLKIGKCLNSVTEEHADILSKIHEKCFQTGWTASDFCSLLLTPGTRATIATISGYDPSPSGFSLTRIAAAECEIIALCVLPNYRRKGIATALLTNLVKEMKWLRISNIFLEVNKNNLSAYRLYASLGFQKVGRRKNYYKVDEKWLDALILRMELKD